MSTATQIGNAEVGESQRLFSETVEAEYRQALDSGQCQPFTIVNFNPNAIGLQGVLKQYSVPSPLDNRLPADVLRVSIPWEGRDRRGHVLTIRAPKKDGKMVGATGTGQPGEVIANRTPKLYYPKEIAFSFMEHFSPVFTASKGTILPPAPKDARKIFGVLVFEGDIHTLEKVLNAEDPSERIIMVPICSVQTVGKTSLKSFKTVPFNIDEYLEQMFAGQKRYADAVITRAQQKWNGTDEDRKDISDSDRVWYRWAIELGFAPKPAQGDKTWLNSELTLIGASEVKVDSRLRKCQACKATEPEVNTPFCPKCSAPINTFETYMAGFPVADAWLMALRGEEREIAIVEMKARKQGFADDDSPVASADPMQQVAAPSEAEMTPGQKAAATRAANKLKATPTLDPTQEIPPADTVLLPGEEG